MRITPYQNYKDSGVEWLGGVTKHWNVQQLKTSAVNGVYQTNVQPIRTLDESRTDILALERQSEGLLGEIIKGDS